MATEQIDFEKPFATVYGESPHRYIQDGHQYAADGSLIGPDVDQPKGRPSPLQRAVTEPIRQDIQRADETLKTAMEIQRSIAPPAPALTIDKLLWGINKKGWKSASTEQLKAELSRLTGRSYKNSSREFVVDALKQIYGRVAEALTVPTLPPEEDEEEKAPAPPAAKNPAPGNLRDYEF